MTELKINDFVKVTGFPVKNDNDIFIVDNQYSNGEYCLKKITLSGTQSKTKYNILFFKAKHFSDPTLSIEIIPNVEGLKQAKKEVNNFLKGITAEEKVYSFVPSTETETENNLTKGSYIKVVKAFSLVSSMYQIPTGTIYACTWARDGISYTLNMVGKKGETLSTVSANGCNKVLLNLSENNINELFEDGFITLVNRIESTKGELATNQAIEVVEETEAVEMVLVPEIDEQREQLINEVLSSPDYVTYNSDISELTITELETIIEETKACISKQITSTTINAEGYAIITTGIGSYKYKYPKDEDCTNDYYIEEVIINYDGYCLDSFIPYAEETKTPTIEAPTPITLTPATNNPINESLAQRSKENMSFSSYTPNSATTEYNQQIAEITKAINSAKSKVSLESQIKLDNLLTSYSSQYANWINKRNANGANHVSVFISGPSNYNMKAHNRFLNREEKLWAEYEELKNINSRIDAILNSDKIIKSNDINAIDKLKEKLTKAQEEHAEYKAYNSNARKEGTTPHMAYVLQNSNGRIKGIKDRIAHLERLSQQETKETIVESESSLTNGIKIVDNVSAHRDFKYFSMASHRQKSGHNLKRMDLDGHRVLRHGNHIEVTKLIKLHWK